MAAPIQDSTKRFSDRVADYVAARPSYATEAIDLLCAQLPTTPSDPSSPIAIVDIGAGTGILTKQLLERLAPLPSTSTSSTTTTHPAIQIHAIEPNLEMRSAANSLLSAYAAANTFISSPGTAEATGLPSHSADLIVAAQAFHWFDVPRARAECRRILRTPQSVVALLWNDRRSVIDSDELVRRGITPAATAKELDLGATESPVTAAYELMLLRGRTDYRLVDHHRRVDKAALDAFFGPDGFEVASFPNPAKLSFEQLRRRLLSSSYAPKEGQEGHEDMMAGLGEVFERYQVGGVVEFVYDTRVFYGRIS